MYTTHTIPKYACKAEVCQHCNKVKYGFYTLIFSVGIAKVCSECYSSLMEVK